MEDFGNREVLEQRGLSMVEVSEYNDGDVCGAAIKLS